MFSNYKIDEVEEIKNNNGLKLPSNVELTTSSISSSSQISPTSSLSSSDQLKSDMSANANDLIASSLWGPPRTVILERESGKSVGISIVGGKLDVFGSTESENFISGIFIKHVLENSPAGVNGTLKTGDRILKVNNIDLTNATHDKAVEVIRNASSPIIFVIQSLLCANYVSLKKKKFFVRVPPYDFFQIFFFF